MADVSAKFGKRITIEPGVARGLLDPQSFLETIETEGGSNPKFIAGDLKVRLKELARTGSTLSENSKSLRESQRKLTAVASGIAREVKPKIGH
jgi:hypothetical protein